MAQEPVPTTHNISENAEVLKIKQEKVDPEIEQKLNNIQQQQQNEKKESKISTSSESEDDDDDSESSQQEDPEDEKKNIEPVKSSNEILAELFKVFNAAPPEELLDDKNLIEKTMKRKKEKKKKHKKANDEQIESESEVANGAGAGSKHKKKKKHKHKHRDGEKPKKKKKDKNNDKDNKKDKEKSKDKYREKKKVSKEKDKSPDLSKHKDSPKHTANGDERHSSSSLRKDLSEHRQKHDAMHSSSSVHKRRHENDSTESSKRRKTDDKDIKQQNSFYGGARDKESHRKEIGRSAKDKVKIKKEVVDRSSSRKMSDEEISEISLSDEEVYLERKDKEADYKKYKEHNSFYAGSNRSRSRETDRNYSKDRFCNQEGDRDRDRDGYHHRNSRMVGGGGRSYYSRRSKSRSRSRDLGIDKKRLLEIARKNVISMFKRGNLPGCDNMTEDIKDKVLLKMRYGGRTVEDLTEFCKKISNGEHLSDLSSDEGSDVDKGGNAKAFHHPFQLKEREPIVMHIRNSKPILPAVKTDEQTKNITMQFPVSSGQQHRMTEAWVPVEPKDKLPPLPVLPAATQSTSIFKSALPKNALGKTLPTESEQEPAFKPVEDALAVVFKPPSDPTPAIMSFSKEAPSPAVMPPIPPFTFTAPPPMGIPAPMPIGVPAPVPPLGVPPPAITAVSNNFIPDVPVPSCRDSIFPESPLQSLDVSSIISKRLNAMRRLQENPMDSEAIKMMYNSQKEMTTWAASKHLPGQFTGSTGVNVLKPNQLNSGPQVWARRDQLTSCKPVTGGMGMHLLQKMGWKPGEGLGRDKNGSLQPLLLDVKLDKRGLVAQDDIKPNKIKRGGGGGGSGGPGAPPPQQNVQDKHPVCLLNEITTKYKWTPPLYTLVHENGPSHSRMFLFSVQVNNETHTPTKLCNTKKEAKFQAAKLCLQKLGMLPPD